MGKGYKKASSKKKKLAELKRREEEERVRIEEEELARIEAERHRIAYEESERVRLLEEARAAREERLRIGEEENHFKQQLPKYKYALQEREKAIFDVRDWKKFLECSELPDPDDESAINSYLTLWRNNPNNDDDTRRNVTNDFKECNIGIELHRLIQGAMYRSINKHQKSEELIHHKHLLQVGEAVLDTLDDMTAYIMQFSDLHIDSETNQFHQITENITYGLWVNIAKNARKKSVHFKDIKASTDLALKGMALQKIAMRVLQLAYDPLTPSCKVAPLLAPLGGIVYVDILNIPPPPSAHKGWTIRKVTDLSKKVKRKPYEQRDPHGNLVDPPETGISFIVPMNVMVRKDVPSVAWWDSKHATWSTEGIDFEQIQFDMASRKLSFTTTHLTTALALVHERTFDIPYRSWKCMPLPTLGKNCALYTIKTRGHTTRMSYIDDVVFFIINDRVKLLSPHRPELKHLFNRFWQPRVLLKRLAEAGLNLLLDDSDAQFTDRTPKLAATEEKAYAEMAWISGFCAFSSSRWNHDASLSNDIAVFQVAKLSNPESSASFIDIKDPTIDSIHSLDDVEHYMPSIPTDSFETMAYWDFKCSFIDSNEESSALSLATIPEHDTHLNTVLTLDEHYASDDIHQWVLDSDPLVNETLRVLLCATRPLSWC
mmetsp:Transcript_4027/g.5949  ORF Transcript_4027/g.5949 Transcript_4027/m.5949 type:complete len:658 (+) Transcript_4027:65-2038(+)